MLQNLRDFRGTMVLSSGVSDIIHTDTPKASFDRVGPLEVHEMDLEGQIVCSICVAIVMRLYVSMG